MESFALAATHSGAINHIHTLTISPAIIGIAREVRMAVTVIIIGMVVTEAWGEDVLLAMAGSYWDPSGDWPHLDDNSDAERCYGSSLCLGQILLLAGPFGPRENLPLNPQPIISSVVGRGGEQHCA
ncbi:hypothetical protein VM1G_11891 [Cytospora mali]|uniref:Uncharacterized protein n=1 Tax=Cytospora mali TaxID=578113 RepID=A0A194WAC2_CYTMA|nr:hypothetical protein VM1G_11891 [Valsa mali]